jgi:hypothetical protein
MFKRSFHAHAYAVSRRAMPAMIEIIETAMRAGFHFDCHEMAGKPELVRVYADPILAVQEPNVSGVLGEKVDRLGQYFPPFDRAEFFAHCAEARGWEARSAASGAGRGDVGSGVLGVGSGDVESGELGVGTALRAVRAEVVETVKPGAQRSGAPDGSAETVPVSEASGAPLRCAPGLVPASTPAPPNSPLRTPHTQLATPNTPRPTSPLPTPATQTLSEAKRHHKANRLAEAGRLYRKALEREPEDAEAYYLLGLLEHQLGHSAAAVDFVVQGAGLQA